MTASPRGRLLRVLGIGFGLAVIVGNTIGAGILLFLFVKPIKQLMGEVN